jgi:murein DD-endopeptidase
MGDGPLGLREVVGLTPPYAERWRQVRMALLGADDVPGSRFDLSSLSQFRPRIGPKLWAGTFPVPRTALVTNLFNHTQTPIERGWSVRKRQVRDFRGRDLTYDSHNGTDFSVPVGTTVVAAAPGRVVRWVSEFNRGGLKLFIDHGDGLMTCTAHLARALVPVGTVVGRGQPVALSGYAGIDGVITFPWGTPHIHFNVWHDARPVDPFPHDGLPSMWRAGPVPTTAPFEACDAVEPSAYDAAAVDAAIASCKTAERRAALQAIEPLWERGAALIAERNYYPTRFTDLGSPYVSVGPRAPVLDLPFAAEQVDGMAFVDDL